MDFESVVTRGAEFVLKAHGPGEVMNAVVLSPKPEGRGMVLSRVPYFEQDDFKSKQLAHAFAFVSARWHGSKVLATVNEVWVAALTEEEERDRGDKPVRELPNRVDALAILFCDGEKVTQKIRPFVRVGKRVEWLEEWDRAGGEVSGWMAELLLSTSKAERNDAMRTLLETGRALYGETVTSLG